MTTKYYLMIDEERKGPYTKEQLVDAGMERDTLVWFKGCSDWLPAAEFPELAELLADLPPPKRRRRDADAPVDLRPQFPEAYLRRPYQFAYAMLVLTLGLIVVGAALGLLAIWIDREIIRDRSLQWIQTTAILGLIASGGIALMSLIAGGIFFLVVLYRTWAIIQDGHASTTPGAAVGFLFIPVFQFYWGFRATLGLAKELNHFADRHRLAAPPAPVLLGATLAVYYVIGAIPFVGTGATVLMLLLIAPLFLRSIYRTARCFCTDNVIPLENVESEPRTMVPSVALFTGVTAMLLGFVGFSCLSIGSVFAPLEWFSYQEATRILEHNRSQVARLEALPENQRGEHVRQNIRMHQSMVDSYERFAVPRAWSRMIGFSIASALGVLLSGIAILCSLVASYSNSQRGFAPADSPI